MVQAEAPLHRYLHCGVLPLGQLSTQLLHVEVPLTLLLFPLMPRQLFPACSGIFGAAACGRLCQCPIESGQTPLKVRRGSTLHRNAPCPPRHEPEQRSERVVQQVPVLGHQL